MIFARVIDALAKYKDNVDFFSVKQSGGSFVIIVNFNTTDIQKVSDELDEITVDIDDNLMSVGKDIY